MFQLFEKKLHNLSENNDREGISKLYLKIAKEKTIIRKRLSKLKSVLFIFENINKIKNFRKSLKSLKRKYKNEESMFEKGQIKRKINNIVNFKLGSKNNFLIKTRLDNYEKYLKNDNIFLEYNLIYNLVNLYNISVDEATELGKYLNKIEILMKKFDLTKINEQYKKESINLNKIELMENRFNINNNKIHKINIVDKKLSNNTNTIIRKNMYCCFIDKLEQQYPFLFKFNILEKNNLIEVFNNAKEINGDNYFRIDKVIVECENNINKWIMSYLTKSKTINLDLVKQIIIENLYTNKKNNLLFIEEINNLFDIFNNISGKYSDIIDKLKKLLNSNIAIKDMKLDNLSNSIRDDINIINEFIENISYFLIEISSKQNIKDKLVNIVEKGTYTNKIYKSYKKVKGKFEYLETEYNYKDFENIGKQYNDITFYILVSYLDNIKHKEIIDECFPYENEEMTDNNLFLKKYVWTWKYSLNNVDKLLTDYPYDINKNKVLNITTCLSKFITLNKDNKNFENINSLFDIFDEKNINSIKNYNKQINNIVEFLTNIKNKIVKYENNDIESLKSFNNSRKKIYINDKNITLTLNSVDLVKTKILEILRLYKH